LNDKRIEVINKFPQFGKAFMMTVFDVCQKIKVYVMTICSTRKP
jgi:hypothetical protein